MYADMHKQLKRNEINKRNKRKEKKIKYKKHYMKKIIIIIMKKNK